MELARDRNKSPARHSNCRCAGIAGAGRKSSRAVTRNGRVHPCAARDAGVFRTTADHGARLAYPAGCSALQQAGANRGGWRLISYDVLTVASQLAVSEVGMGARRFIFLETSFPGFRRIGVI